jgi:hypothetical protein
MSYLLAQMLAHCRARRLANAVSQPVASRTGVPTAGNGVQVRHFVNFMNLSAVRRTVSLPSATRSSSNAPTPSTRTTPLLGSGTQTPILSNLTTLPSPTVSSSTTEAEKAAQEAEDQARDLRTVRNDLHRYKQEPPPPDNVPLDLVRYWNVSFCACCLRCCAELK